MVGFFLHLALAHSLSSFSSFFTPISSLPLFVLPLFMPLILLTSLLFLSIFVLFLPVFVPRLPAPSHPEWTRVGASTSISLQAPPDSDSMTQSTAMRAEGGTTGAHSELCHCPPEQTDSRGSKEREGGGGETGRETRNQLVREGWQSDSQCTITLVFRFGPSERSFWTQLCLNVSSYSLFFLFFFSCMELTPMETHSCHASLLFPV